MAKVKKLFGTHPECIAVLAEIAEFGIDGIAEVSEEAAEVFGQIHGYELVDENTNKDGEEGTDEDKEATEDSESAENEEDSESEEDTENTASASNIARRPARRVAAKK